MDIIQSELSDKAVFHAGNRTIPPAEPPSRTSEPETPPEPTKPTEDATEPQGEPEPEVNAPEATPAEPTQPQQPAPAESLRREIALRDQRIADLQVKEVETEIESTITMGLLGQRFAGSNDASQAVTADVVTSFIRGRLEGARDAAGKIHIREKGTGRPAAEVIKEVLTGFQYQQFFASDYNGGGGGGGGLPTGGHFPSSNSPYERITQDFLRRQAANGAAWLTRMRNSV